MRKIILALVVAGFALTVFISLRPQAMNLVVTPDQPGTVPIEEVITLEAVPDLTVIQGGDCVALLVKNNTAEHYSFSLGHEHSYITLQPQGGWLTPWTTNEVSLKVDPKCPPGQVELPVYLRADINGTRTGFETTVNLSVIGGALTLEQRDGDIYVLWNDEQAPRGTSVYYRSPGTVEWKLWGESPRLDPPAELGPGQYLLEFKAILGDVESEIERFEINVPEPEPEPKPEPERTTSSGGGGTAAPAPEPEPEPQYADQNTREAQREIRQAYETLKDIEVKFNAIYKPFSNSDDEKRDLSRWKSDYEQIIRALRTKYGIRYEYRLADGGTVFSDDSDTSWIPFGW